MRIDARTRTGSRTGVARAAARAPWLLLITMLLVLVFQGQAEMNRLLTPPSPEWSRPLPIGTAETNRSFGQVVLPDGRLLVVWAQDRGFRSHLVRSDGQLEQSQEFLTDQAAPNSTRLLLTDDGVLLFWLDFPNRTLRTASISMQGELPSHSKVITTGVDAYAVALGGSPLRPTILARQNGSAIFLSHREGGWEPVATTAKGHPNPSAEPGEPVAALDLKAADDGTLHGAIAKIVADTYGNRLDFYSWRLAPDGQLEIAKVAERPLEQLKETLGNFASGLDNSTGYLFWGIERNNKGERDTLSEYVSWPLEQAPSAPLPLRRFVLAEASQPSLVTPSPEQSEQLYVTVPAIVGGGKVRVVEAMEVVMQGGDIKEQRIAGPTRSTVYQPQLIRDGDNRWLTWGVPGGTGVTLKTASTHAEFRQTQSGRRAADWSEAVGNTALNIGYAYLPMVVSMLWFLPAVIFIILSYMFALTWAEHHPFWLNLGGAVIYLAAKLYFAPRMLFAPAVTSGMPTWMVQSLLPITVLTMVVASAELFWRNRRWVIGPVTDGLLRLAIYDTLLMALIIAPYMR